MKKTWLEEIVEVLKELGGEAYLDQIYCLVERRGNKKLTGDWKATIRQTIEDHSSDSRSFRSGKDIFYSVELRSGKWRLRIF